MQDLYLFSAGSANDDSNKQLWVKGASLFIPQINELLECTNFQFKIVDVQNFHNENVTHLGDILANNKSDKSTEHNYHNICLEESFLLGKNLLNSFF